MSVAEPNIIDAIGTSEDGHDLKLMISDHMNWEHESIHLEILQDKINAYVQFIEGKQYADKYSDDFFKFVIDIYFKEKITENCLNFLNVASRQLNPANIFINMHFD